MARITDPRRDERREARKAVAEARRASAEAGKLAKTLSRETRANLETLTAAARADVRGARKELSDDPRHAKHRAKQAAARLELASLRVTASGDAERKTLADAAAKKHAKVIKRRRVQSQQARKMARSAAFHAIVGSVTLSTDREQAKADFALDERLRDRVAKYAHR
ncbi:hypothetical protein [Agromyces neolithicus]|uniref:DNA-binding protein n=1 Tax=Agromyces neolithicus TaxID=269420 RepID=A0ABN2M3C0_9MICO